MANVGLRLYGLGVSGDCQPPAVPRLAEGIHLRWTFGIGSGLPWHGYHVLRRYHRKSNAGSALVQRAPSFGPPSPHDWVPGSHYPIVLPVRHDDYPARHYVPWGSGPALDASWSLAQARLRYEATPAWTRARFGDLFEALVRLVEGGPAVAMRDRPLVPPEQDAPAKGEPRVGGTILDALMLGSVHPDVAQLLGLYLVDDQALEGMGYDYMVIADFDGAFAGRPARAAAWANGATSVDGASLESAVIENVIRGHAAKLEAPTGLQAFTLPAVAATYEDAHHALQAAAGLVGLDWEKPGGGDVVGGEGAGALVYRVRRARVPDSPNGGPPTSYPPEAAFADVSDDLLIPAVARVGKRLQVPPGWPRKHFCHIDGPLVEGWYTYRVQARDVFGRWSPPSDPCWWMDWKPVENAPEGAPDYKTYVVPEVPSGNPKHAFAIHLLDNVAPPPPSAIEVSLIDPLDETLTVDGPVRPWLKNAKPGDVALRVRWRWTHEQWLQAPDCETFRIYWRPGRFGVTEGRVTKIIGNDAGTCVVQFAPDPGQKLPSAAQLAKAGFHCGSDRWEVDWAAEDLAVLVLSQAPSAGGPNAPAIGAPCTIVVEPDVNLAAPNAWSTRVAVVSIEDFVDRDIQTLLDHDGCPVAGTANATASPRGISVPKSHSGPDLGAIRPGLDLLFLDGATNSGIVADDQGAFKGLFPITGVGIENRELRLDVKPEPPPEGSTWAVGRPYRQYDILIDAGELLALPTELKGPFWPKPLFYGQVGVSSADGRLHAADVFTVGSGPALKGNESGVAGPFTVARVCCIQPPVPQLDDTGDEPIWATRADVQGRSFFTLRWKPPLGLLTRIYRASEQSVLSACWNWLMVEAPALHAKAGLDAIPAAGQPAPDVNLQAAPKASPFEPSPGSGAGTGEKPAKLIGGLPEDVFNGLPDKVKTKLLDLDKVAGILHATIGGTFQKAQEAHDPVTDADLLYLANLDASLGAFAPVTDGPIESGDFPDLGPGASPDAKEGYVPEADKCAFVDTLPGKTKARYVYRVAYADHAGNESSWSGVFGPVRTRGSERPPMPVIVEAYAGTPEFRAALDARREVVKALEEPGLTPEEVAALEGKLVEAKAEVAAQEAAAAGKVTLRWTVGEGEATSSVALYRTDVEADAGDLRKMKAVSVEPTGSAMDVVAVHSVMQLDSSLCYIVVAEDNDGNVSKASAPATAMPLH